MHLFSPGTGYGCDNQIQGYYTKSLTKLFFFSPCLSVLFEVFFFVCFICILIENCVEFGQYSHYSYRAHPNS